jgi:putative phosphoribosyl transferase
MMSGRARFADRRDGGRHLAGELTQYAGREDVVVLGLPRGGVPVACEVADALGAPLDVFVVRKLGVPGHEELAMGAIASGGVRVLNQDVVAASAVSPEEIERVTQRELETLLRQEGAFRGERPPVAVKHRTAIAVDDGLATGATMRAAVTALRERAAAAIIVAVPTAPRETCAALRNIADEVVCATTPDPFMAVGLWYANFAPVSDEEVQAVLAGRSREAGPPAGGSTEPPAG